MGSISVTRLYASSIAIVSGLYSIGVSAAAAMDAPMMTDRQAEFGIGGWIMLGVGIVVLLHGIVLLSPAAERLRELSGPLMVAWSAIMLLNQVLAATMMGEPMAARMGWDAGMVAIAVLMLISGLIMTTRRSTDGRM